MDVKVFVLPDSGVGAILPRMASESVRIVADDRENTGGVIAQLSPHPEVRLEIRRLAAGDFIVEQRFVVERKTLADFARSIIDGRLFKQTTALAQDPRRGILVLEGTGPTDKLGVSREALQGALITVSVFFGLSVLRARDPAETARLLVYLGRQTCEHARGGLARCGYRPKGRRARQLYVLQGLPGIGPDRAERLLEHFGSVPAVFLASDEALTAVKGIGPVVAKRVRWVLEADPRSSNGTRGHGEE